MAEHWVRGRSSPSRARSPRGRRGVDDDAGPAEPAVKQVLREGAAERVSNQDRRLGQRADEAVVVVDEFVDVDLGEPGVRERTQLGSRAVIERP